MAKFPLRVKTRDSTGVEIEVLCDMAESALGNVRHLRGTGHGYVWIEALTVIWWMRNPCTPRGPRGEEAPRRCDRSGRIGRSDRNRGSGGLAESIDDGERSLPRRNPKLIVASVRTAEARRAVNNQHVLIARLKVACNI